MRDETQAQRLIRLVAKAEAELEAMKQLPKLREKISLFDEFLGAKRTRKRGDRSKGEGALLVEAVAVGAIRVLKRHYRLDGLSAPEAWEKARRFVGKLIGVRPATLEDWQRGAAARRRRRAAKKRKSKTRSFTL